MAHVCVCCVRLAWGTVLDVPVLYALSGLDSRWLWFLVLVGDQSLYLSGVGGALDYKKLDFGYFLNPWIVRAAHFYHMGTYQKIASDQRYLETTACPFHIYKRQHRKSSV